MTEETQTPEAGKKTCEFKAEVRKVLQILTNSLYTNREIFLRELVSNASDALDKLRFRQSKGETPSASDLPLEIRITLDKDKKTLTIADTGIGMTEQDLADNLGIIARSGSENFLAQLAAQSKTTDDKGQARPADHRPFRRGLLFRVHGRQEGRRHFPSCLRRGRKGAYVGERRSRLLHPVRIF